MNLEELKNKSILILGFGKEGVDTLNFLRTLFPKKIIGVADKDPNCKANLKKIPIKNIKWYLGEDYLKAIKNYEIVIKSPGIPIHLPEVEKAFKQNKITSATEIFFRNCQGKIVGITGTKGKSTTTLLTYKVLKEGGLKAKLIGNIGKPPLKYLLSENKNNIFVYELSAHQLYKLKVSPQIAVFLNIFPEHLDYYKNFKEYLMAKANITLWQKKDDILIYNAEQQEIKEIIKKSPARKILLRKNLCAKIIKEMGIKRIPLVGDFYQLNVAVAILIGKIFNLSKEKIKKAVEGFKPLPHRLELVGEFKGIKFYNDSLSTIPETTLAALGVLGNKVQTLILGGYDRGISFHYLVKEILKKKVKNLILFPPSGERIWKEILNQTKDDSKLPKTILVQNMKDAVKVSFQITQKGKICLLSPASPSFGLFMNYQERGNLFKKYVKYYGKKI